MIRKLLVGAVLALAGSLLLLPVLAFAQDTGSPDEVARWFAAVCGQQDLIVTAVKYVLAPIGGAALLANLRAYLPGPLVAVLDLVGANWSAILRAAMDGAKKTTPVAFILFLASCSLAQVQQGLALAPSAVAAVCQDVQQDGALAAQTVKGGAAAQVASINLYVGAGCGTAGAIAKLAADSSSIAWLQQNQAALKGLTAAGATSPAPIPTSPAPPAPAAAAPAS